MKIFKHLLLGIVLAAPCLGLDAAQLAAVSQKFAAKSPEEQYKARLELNALVDAATAPGAENQAAVNELLAASLSSGETPHEAKKYLLRVISKTGSAAEVPVLAALLESDDKLLSEEARRALELIPGPESLAALEAALKSSQDQVEQNGLLNSLAIHQADSSIPLISSFAVNDNEQLVRAAIMALARINSPASFEALTKAYASPLLGAPAKLEVERALLKNEALDEKTAMEIYASTTSNENRITAFTALVSGDMNEEKQAILEEAIRSEDDWLRQAALRRGLEVSLPSLQSGLASAIGKLSPGDRLVVFANVNLLKPSEIAEGIALAGTESSDPLERIAAIRSLAELSSNKAFELVLQATGDPDRQVSQAAGIALSGMNCAEGGSILASMLTGDSKEDTILAIRSVSKYEVADSDAILMKLLGSDEASIAQEAMKVIYGKASLVELKQLCSIVLETEDEKKRKKLVSLCRKIAKRIDSDEAQTLVQGLK